MRWKRLHVPAALVLLSACGDHGGGLDFDKEIAQVIVSPSEAYLFVGENRGMDAEAVNKQGWKVPMEGPITWSSSNPSVVQVSSRGVAQGVSPGAATVTAASDGKEGSALLTVRDLTLLLDEGGHGLLYRSWGSSAHDVFAVGTCEIFAECGIIRHYDGGSWNAMATPPLLAEFRGVWGSSGENVFAVGGSGTILHYDGQAWTGMPSGTTAGLNAVWGASATDVFAAGRGLFHYDGQGWSPMTSPEGIGELRSIWGSSGEDVFAVGESGTVLHYDGTTWAEMPHVTVETLHAVWGSSTSNVYAVGEGGTVLHYDGSAWKSVPVPTAYHLTGIWGRAGNDIFAVGVDELYWWGPSGSVILHYDGGGWGVVEIGAPQVLYGAWGTAEDIFLVGGYGPKVLYQKR